MKTPRPYQIEAIFAPLEFMAEHDGHPIVALPTGTGKALVIALTIYELFKMSRDIRIMVVSHSKHIVQQDFDELIEAWPTAPAGMYCAGLKRKDFDAPIIFAGIDSVMRKADIFGHIDILIIDEAHAVNADSEKRYGRFIGDLMIINPCMRVFGYTATAYRMDSGLLTEGAHALFTDVCCDYTTRARYIELLSAGYLVPHVTRSAKAFIDTTGVKMRGGDFVESELAKLIMGNKGAIAAAVREVIEHTANRRHSLNFCASKEHADLVCSLFREYGQTAVVMHTGRTDDENTEAMREFTMGRAKYCVNIAQLTTGFNYRPIDHIGIMRPTRSVPLWVQIGGRGSRICPEEGKIDCLVSDFGKCAENLGPFNDPILPGKKRPDCARCPGERAKGEGRCIHCGKVFGGAPMKSCPQCGLCMHTAIVVCPECGFLMPRVHEVQNTASSAAVLDLNTQENDLAILDTVDVRAQLHTTKLGRTSLRVTYGLAAMWPAAVSEFVHFDQATPWAGHHSREWWSQHVADGPAPLTYDDAMARVREAMACGAFCIPRQLKVRVPPRRDRTKYPSIVAKTF